MNTFLEALNDKIDDFAIQLKEHLSGIFDVMSGHELLQLEQSAETLFQKATGELFGAALQAQISNKELRREAINAMNAGHRRWKSKGLRTVRIKMVFGTVVEVRTSYYVRDLRGRRGRKRKKRGAKGSGCYPVLEALGIRNRITPAAIEKIARMVVICSSIAESREQLAKAGFELNFKTVRSLSWEFGKQAMEAQLEKLKNWLKQAAEEDSLFANKRVVATIDGGRLRVRTPQKRGRRKKNGRHSFQVDWEEPRVICLYLIDEEGKKIAEAETCWYDASIANADKCFEVLEAHLQGLGIKQAKQLVFVADGASWIWNRVGELWTNLGLESSQVVEVVDFYHAAEHLHDIAKLRKSWKAFEVKAWYENMRKRLKNGQVKQVIECIEELARGRKSKTYVKKMDYFVRHQERMQYGQFKAARLPIGSGAVESAVRRIVNQRMKGPGIMWLRESAQAMLLMRAYTKAGRWHQLIDMVLSNSFQYQEIV